MAAMEYAFIYALSMVNVHILHALFIKGLTNEYLWGWSF